MSEILDGYCTPGTERETILPSAELLRQMDRAGIARAVIAPEDREIAAHNAAGNQRILTLARAGGGRFIPACSANPWFGAAAISEMQQAVAEGARMLVLAPALQGFILGDELTDDLLTAAGKMNLPVYVHTGPHSAAAPSQLALLAERLSSTRFILGHCGSTDHAWDMPSIFKLRLPNLWFELSFVRPWGMPAYGSLADESRWIFGTSAPRNDPEFELRRFDADWPIVKHDGTYGANLAELLKAVRS